MKAFTNYEDASKNARYTGSAQLEPGAYVCNIINVQYQEGKDGNSDLINILFDVYEGDQKGFFKKQYEASTDENKKWKGRHGIWVPSDDGSEKDGWTKNAFAKWTNGFEDSNAGYKWDWEEDKWKGKLIGIVFRRCGKVIDGKPVEFTEVAFPCSADEVRKGTVKAAKFKAYSGYDEAKNAAITADNGTPDFVSVDNSATEEEIPF